MPVEVECSNCAGRMMAEPGAVVSCPHCGEHLTVPGEPAAEPPGALGDSPTNVPPEPGADKPPETPEPPEESPTVSSDEPSSFPGLPPGDTDSTITFPNLAASSEGAVAPTSESSAERGEERMQSEPDQESPTILATPAEQASTPMAALDSESPSPPSPQQDGGATRALMASLTEVPVVIPPPEDSPDSPSEKVCRDRLQAVSQPAEAGHYEPAPRLNSSDSPRAVVPKLWFVIAVSYASAVTLALILVTVNSMTAKPHELESLPDLKPPQKDDKIALQLAPEEVPMPAGHTLRLGEKRRFGNVVVEPLRVTRGPLQFVHYSGDESRTRDPTGDVLKLWLRFTNVSDDQVFAPLDRKLMLTRVPDERPGTFRANNFVCRIEEKRQDGQRVMVYDIPPTSDWELKGQHIGRRLGPGESFVTYIATEEDGIDQLEGDLIWRVHFRKGYNPDSLRGVTTLIEVVFSSDQIQPETG